MIRVEFFDLARVRAGTAAVDVTGATVREVLRAATVQCPGLDGAVLDDGVAGPHWRVSINGGPFLLDPDTPVRDGDAVLVLSAQAGG